MSHIYIVPILDLRRATPPSQTTIPPLRLTTICNPECSPYALHSGKIIIPFIYSGFMTTGCSPTPQNAFLYHNHRSNSLKMFTKIAIKILIYPEPTHVWKSTDRHCAKKPGLIRLSSNQCTPCVGGMSVVTRKQAKRRLPNPCTRCATELDSFRVYWRYRISLLLWLFLPDY